MKKINIILVAIIIVSINSTFSQKRFDSIYKNNDSIRFHINSEFKIQKFGKSNRTFSTLDLYEVETYINSIVEKFGIKINSISGGGYTNIILNQNIELKVGYGTLNFDNNFLSLTKLDNKRVSGRVLGLNIGISIKKKRHSRLFLSIGNDWIKIDNGNSISNFRAIMGIKINN